MINKHTLSLFFIYISLFTGLLKADGLNPLLEQEKKYDISICAIFKNEASYLEDWIEYHLSIGVNHFYLYNIGSQDAFEKVLKPYLRKNMVTLVNWPEALIYQDDDALHWALTTQIPAYENSVNYLAKFETEWLVFMDIDEFLVLTKGTIKELLNKYKDFPGITFSSEFFDGAIYDTLSKKTLISETYDLTDIPPENIHKTVTKMIFKPELCMGFNWPPYECRFKEFVSCFEVDRQELKIKRCLNRNIIQKFFGKNLDIGAEASYPLLYERPDENINRPMYQQIPEFLIRLNNSLENYRSTHLLN